MYCIYYVCKVVPVFNYSVQRRSLVTVMLCALLCVSLTPMWFLFVSVHVQTPRHYPRWAFVLVVPEPIMLFMDSP